MKATRLIGLCGLSGLVLGVTTAVTAPRAHAFYHAALPASACQPEWMDLGHTYTASDPGMVLNSSSTANFVCPVPDNSNMQHQNLNIIKVRALDYNVTANPSARACAWNPATGMGGSCGLEAATFAADGISLVPELSQLTTASETAYIWVFLPSNTKVTDLYFEDS